MKEEIWSIGRIQTFDRNVTRTSIVVAGNGRKSDILPVALHHVRYKISLIITGIYFRIRLPLNNKSHRCNTRLFHVPGHRRFKGIDVNPVKAS